MAHADLYDIRNALTLGNYLQVISDAEDVKPSQYGGSQASSKELIVGRDFYLALAQIGLRRYSAALSEMEGKTHPMHRAARLLAQYLKIDASGSAGDAAREKVAMEAKALADDTLCEEKEASPSTALMATTCATILIHYGDYETAFTWMRTWNDSLKTKQQAAEKEDAVQELKVLRQELLAVVVDIMLRINHKALAAKELKEMHNIDPESAVCMLWTGLADLEHEGVKNFKALRERYGNSAFLLNCLALAHMARGEFEEAQSHIDEVLSLRENDPDALINSAVVQRQLKPTAGSKAILEQLRSQFPAHPWVRKYESLDAAFDDAAEKVSAS